jgi:hypothetical protein
LKEEVINSGQAPAFGLSLRFRTDPGPTVFSKLRAGRMCRDPGSYTWTLISFEKQKKKKSGGRLGGRGAEESD